MGCKREEMKKKKCFKEFIKNKKGMIYFIVFVILVGIIPLSSEGLLRLIRTMDNELLIKIIKCIFAFTLIPAYLKMVIENLKKEVK